MRILITDSDSRPALAATRSLGRKGYSVFTAGERSLSLAAASRYSSKFVQYPTPALDPEGFVSEIVRAVHSLGIDILLPMTEVTTLLLTEQRSLLPKSCSLPFADAAAVAEASDKARVIDMARALSVPVPATTTIHSAREIERLAGGWNFPMVIKPARSRVRTDEGWANTGVHYAHDATDLLAQLRGLRPEFYPILLQERIRGHGIGIFACYDKGRPVAFFAHRRLREKPPSGGVSVLSESTPLNPEALGHSTLLLNRLNWHGVAMIEFKQDSRDGALRLMEINGRFWGSLQLAIDAGVDFPAILVDVARGLTRQPIGSYRLGIQSRWFLGDFDAFVATLVRARRELNLPAGYPSRLRLFWEFMHLWGRQMHYEVLTLEDPMPGWVELRRWLSGT